MKRLLRILFTAFTATILCLAMGCGPEKKEVEISLTKKQAQAIREELSDIPEPVTLTSFVGKNFPNSNQASSFYDSISDIEERIIREKYTLDKDTNQAQTYGISLAPAVIIHKSNDVGIRFFGLPSGYEFSSLIEIIGRLSSDSPGISPESATSLASLKTPVTIKVFTLPS